MSFIEKFVEFMFAFVFGADHLVDFISMVGTGILHFLWYGFAVIFCLTVDYVVGLIVSLLHIYSALIFLIQVVNLGIMLILVKFVNRLLDWVSGGRYQPLAIFRMGDEDVSTLIYFELARFCARLLHLVQYAMDRRQPWVDVLVRMANDEYANAQQQMQRFLVPGANRPPGARN